MNFYKINKELLNKKFNFKIFKHKRYKIIVYANEKYKSDPEIKQILCDMFISPEELEIIIKRKK